MNRPFPYSTVQECGVTPSGWVRVAVSRLIEKHFCGPSPDCEERQIASDEEWGVLKTTAITWDGWNETAHKVLPRAYWGRHEIEVKTGDVLVTKAGPRDRVGVVVYVKSAPRRLIVSGKMIGLRLRHAEVLPQVLAGVLSLRGPQEYIHARTTGMAESQVNFANEVLLNTEVCIPSLTEQFRIAAVLDTVDEAIAQTEAVIAKLKQIRMGLLHDLLTRGLDENGQRRDPVAHPEQFQDSRLGKVPREWEVATLGCFLVNAEYGISTSLDTQGVLPVLRMNNLAEGEASLADIKYATCNVPDSLRLRTGDVLFNRTNSYEHVGRTGIWRGQLPVATFASYLVRLNPVPGRISSEFLNLVLNAPESQARMRQFATPAVQQVNINPTSLQQMLVAVPKTLAEQDSIGKLALRSADEITVERAELNKLYQLKSGLMNDLLTGRVRVPEGIAVTG
jgi:type I restriction enzyme S subunit